MELFKHYIINITTKFPVPRNTITVINGKSCKFWSYVEGGVMHFINSYINDERAFSFYYDHQGRLCYLYNSFDAVSYSWDAGYLRQI